jgi:hypothetical protein
MPPAPIAKPDKKQMTPVNMAVLVDFDLNVVYSPRHCWASLIAAASRSSEVMTAALAASAAAVSMASSRTRLRGGGFRQFVNHPLYFVVAV